MVLNLQISSIEKIEVIEFRKCGLIKVRINLNLTTLIIMFKINITSINNFTN